MNEDDHAARCPLAAVDRRLEDAHQLWHQAERFYFEPEAFRLAAQNAIQTLRTVTFILQNHKHIFAGFDEWYAEWQQRMRESPLMRWMVDARNKIEKQGDLEARSFIRAELIASYLDDGPRLEVPAGLFDGPSMLLQTISDEHLKKHVQETGTLRIQRRWVENSLPDRELLDAVASAYGFISELVADAHSQLGLAVPGTQDRHSGEQYDKAALGGRMPCMVGHEDARSLLISVADGSVLTFGEKRVPYDESEFQKAAHRYGLDASIPKSADTTFRQLADILLESAKKVLVKDGYHASFVYLFRKRQGVGLFSPVLTSTREKYLLMRAIAREAAKHGADAAMMLNEAWMAGTHELEHPYQRASEVPTRKEALVLSAVERSGEPFQLIAMIDRSRDGISVGETTEMAGSLFAFAPLFELWGRPLPQALAENLKAMQSEAATDFGREQSD